MADLKLRVLLEGIDGGLSRTLREGRTELNRFDRAGRSAASSRRAAAGDARVQRMFSRGGRVLQGVGLGIGHALASATRQAVSFDTAFMDAAARVKELREGTGALRDKTSKDLRALAVQMRVAPEEAAGGMEKLALAGLNLDQIMAQLPGLLKSARANSEDFVLVADRISDLASAMHPDDVAAASKEYGRLSDVITRLTQEANVDFRQLSAAMLKIGPSALTKGLDPETFSAMAAALGSVGIKSNEGGTAVRNFLNFMTGKDTKKARQAMKDMGITQEQVMESLKSNDPAGLLDRMRESLDKMSSVKRNKALLAIFGTRQVTTAEALLKSTDAIRKLQKSARESSGTTADVFGMKEESKGAKLDRVKRGLSDLAIEVGDSLLPVLTELAAIVTPIIKDTGEWMRENPRLAAGLVQAAGGAALLSFGLGTLLRLGGPLVQTVKLASGASRALSTGFELAAARGGALGKVAGFMGGPLGKQVGLMGRLGQAGLVAAAAYVGWEIGSWIDEMTGASDAIADFLTKIIPANEELQKLNALSGGLTNKRGADKLTVGGAAKAAGLGRDEFLNTRARELAGTSTARKYGITQADIRSRLASGEDVFAKTGSAFDPRLQQNNAETARALREVADKLQKALIDGFAIKGRVQTSTDMGPGGPGTGQVGVG